MAGTTQRVRTCIIAPATPSPRRTLQNVNVCATLKCLEAAAKAEWGRIGVDLHLRFWDALLDRYLGAAQRDRRVSSVPEQ